MSNYYQEAHRLFSYDEKSGRLFHKITRGRSAAGVPAGHLAKSGYIVLGFLGKKYLAHRVIWLMKTGDFPDVSIDHIDRNHSNNKMENLRLATPVQQQGNMPLAKNNSSGARGVRKNKNKWQALLNDGGKQRYLGGFSSKAEAMAAYDAAARIKFGEFYQS